MPRDDVVTEQNQMREEETARIAKGVKRKRTQHECDVCEKVFRYPSKLAEHMRTHTKEKRTNAMCARSILLNPVI